MNLIVIKGRLVRDPELRQTGNGTSVCTVDLAVDRPYSKEKETDFFTVVFWRQAAEFVAQYFTKGREMLVQGEMQSRKYEDKEGNNRTAWEVKADRVEFVVISLMAAVATKLLLPRNPLLAIRRPPKRTPRLPPPWAMTTEAMTTATCPFKELLCDTI